MCVYRLLNTTWTSQKTVQVSGVFWMDETKKELCDLNEFQIKTLLQLKNLIPFVKLYYNKSYCFSQKPLKQYN